MPADGWWRRGTEVQLHKMETVFGLRDLQGPVVLRDLVYAIIMRGARCVISLPSPSPLGPCFLCALSFFLP